MSVTSRLVFDPTDANTRAASSNVGAYLRAGDDGTLIGHVSDALKVSFTNSSLAVTASDLDIRDLLYTQDSITAHQGGTWDIGTVGTITNAVTIQDGGNSITVDGTVAATQSGTWAMRLQDGSGNAITSTGGALDVNIASGTLTINDSALANTAITTEAVAVSTSAVAVTTSVLANRKYLLLCNNDTKEGFFGPSGVTTANGFPLGSGEKAELRCGASVDVYYIGGTGSSNEDFRTAQLS